MKTFKKILSGAMTLAFSATVMFSSVSTGLALENWDTVRTDFSKVVLAPGADESQLNFAWYSTNKDEPIVQIVKADEDFSNAGEFNGTNSTAYRNSDNNTQYYSNKVTATGLLPNTSYKYRYKTGDSEWSKEYSYQTQSTENGFGFIAVGDVQIGVGNGGSEKDTERWENTLKLATENLPNASFVMSVGDQVDGNKEEDQYAGFLYPEKLRSLPISTVAGNHDCDVPNLTWHFNNPNQTNYGQTNAGGDYYYSYGDLLVISLNLNAVLKSTKSNNAIAVEHRKCIEEAIKSNPYAKWRVIDFHQDIYGYPDHYTDPEVTKCREQLYPIIDDYDIDVVLTGHGHNYTRSFPMENNKTVKDSDVDYNSPNVSVNNPNGTVYFELSTAASKNYENNKAGYNSHIAKSFAVNMVQSYSLVKVTDSSFTIETYRTDTNEMYDSYTINKNDRTKLDKSIEKAESIIASGDYSGAKLDNLKTELEKAKIVQSETPENSDLQKAYDTAVSLDEAIFDMKPVLYGDVNGDGDVRINDAIVLQKYITNKDVTLTKRQLEAASIVGDSPSVKDVTAIQKYLAEIIPSLNK